MSDAFPKAVTREAVHVADVVVTLGESDSGITGLPSTAETDASLARILHWDLPSLTDQPDDFICAALVELDIRVLALHAEILSAAEPRPGRRRQAPGEVPTHHGG